MVGCFPCPHCGEPVRANSRFCRECGSDARTGWSEEAETGGLDLPESMSPEEYEDFLGREFPDRSSPGSSRARRQRRARLGMILALALLILLLVVLRVLR